MGSKGFYLYKKLPAMGSSLSTCIKSLLPWAAGVFTYIKASCRGQQPFYLYKKSAAMGSSF
jgi:hypothetical protein